MLQTLFNLYYEKLWDPGSELYIVDMVKKDSYPDKLSVPLSGAGVFPLEIVLDIEAQPGFHPDYAKTGAKQKVIAILENPQISGLHSLQPHGKAVFISSFNNILLPLKLEQVIVQTELHCFPVTEDGEIGKEKSKGILETVITGISFAASVSVKLSPLAIKLLGLEIIDSFLFQQVSIHPEPGKPLFKKRLENALHSRDFLSCFRERLKTAILDIAVSERMEAMMNHYANKFISQIRDRSN